MRIALHSTVALVITYLAVLGGFAWWVEREIRDVASALMEDTARLVGSEIAATMSGPALDQLLGGDPSTRLRLVQIVAELSERSNVVASIAVVDEQGEVVASDELEVGHQLALPGMLFQDALRPQLLSSNPPFSSPTYYLSVPLVRDGKAVGYIRLSLRSQQIARLYRTERRQLALAALAGLASIGLLGFLLQVQLRRRSTALAAALEATVRGEAPALRPQLDEFSQAIDAAGRLGRELNAARERSTHVQRRMHAIANFMDVGVIILGRDDRPEFANATACMLLGCKETQELESRWAELRPRYVGALAELRDDDNNRVDIDLPDGDRMRRLRLEAHRASDEHEGTLLLLKDRDQLEAFETDLRLAAQMRGLARVYSALAHELRAPLGAMALNLELLRDTLAKPDGAGNERPLRYATVLQEELSRLNRSLLMLLNQTTAVDEKRETFDVGALLQDLQALLTPQAKRQGVALTVAAPAQAVQLSGHRDRLKQALLNLATNALEVMPDGGELKLHLESSDSKAQLSVCDTGPGIAPEVAEKMFSLYFTTKPTGTGIGLYVTRSIIEAHGGELRCESSAGNGACFHIELPVEKAAAAGGYADSLESTVGSR